MLLRQILSEKLLSTPPSSKFDSRNTPFFNILRANSFLAIFYPDFFRHHDANPCILKDLETRSGIFFIQIDPPKTLQLPKHGEARTQWQSVRGYCQQKPKPAISSMER